MEVIDVRWRQVKLSRTFRISPNMILSTNHVSFDLPQFCAPGHEDIKWYFTVKIVKESNQHCKDCEHFSERVAQVALRLSPSSKRSEVLADVSFRVEQNAPASALEEMKAAGYITRDHYALWEFSSWVHQHAKHARDIHIAKSLNTLNISVNITQVVGIDTFTEISSPVTESTDSGKDLQSSLGKLLENGTNSDFVIEVENEKFPVHRAILSARSDVFAAMLQPYTQESKSGRATLLAENAQDFKHVLKYLYSGVSPSPDADLLGVLLSADRLQISGLKSVCLEKLLANPTVDSLCEILRAGCVMDISSAGERPILFVLDNMQQVLSSSAWKQLAEDMPTVALNALQKALQFKCTSGSSR